MTSMSLDAHITPWEVQGNFRSDQLISQFGCSKLTESHLNEIERLTGCKAPAVLRRGIFFAHRDFDQILECYKNKEPFYLYTGRGPSSQSLHLGHLIPLLFTKWLQEAFKVPLVIQITDDEKFLWKNLKLEEAERLAAENIKDIIACGFDPKMTFIFTDFNYFGGEFSRNIKRIERCVTFNQVRAIFGMTADDSIGKIGFPAIQAAPAFSSSFPHLFDKKVRCLIPAALDQDPHFRLIRDVAPRLGFHKPSVILSNFLPPLQGVSHGKMSSSQPQSVILISDSQEIILKKLNKYAFSGGQESRELQMKYGANVGTDIAFQYLRHFLEDDLELAEIQNKYASGKMMSSHVKKRLSEILGQIFGDMAKKREKITSETMRSFCE